MFGVHGAESFQAEYQKLIDTWMRRFTEIENSLAQNKSKLNQEEDKEIEKDPVKLNDIKIWDSEGNILYEKGKTYDITPDQIQKIEEGSQLSPSDKLEGLPSLNVEVDGKTFFQSKNGEVLVNRKPSEPVVQNRREGEGSRQVQPDFDYGDYPDSVDDYSVDSPEISDSTADILIELMAPIIEAMPTVEPEVEQQSEPSLMDFLEPESDSQPLEALAELSSTAPYVPKAEQQDGLSALQNALQEMKPAALKDVLQGMTTDMKATAIEQEPNPDMEALVKSRLEERQNPHWWDKVSAKVETMVSRVRDTFTQHRAASTLKDFAAGMGLQPGESYQGASYNISRHGKDYTLTDKQGNELMKFQSSPMGVKVDKSLPALDFSHYSNRLGG